MPQFYKITTDYSA